MTNKVLSIAHDYFLLPESVDGSNAVHQKPYTIKLADEICKNPNVVKDLNRIAIRFGDAQNDVLFPYENLDDYLDTLIDNAKENNLHLTRDQAKILVAYLNSSNGTPVQQGVPSIPYGAMKILFLLEMGIVPSKVNSKQSDIYHHVYLQDNQLHISAHSMIQEVWVKKEKGDMSAQAIKLSMQHDYVIEEDVVNNFYHIKNNSNKNKMSMDADFYQHYYLPAVKSKLAEIDDFSADANGFSKSLYLSTPFMEDEAFAELFIDKILASGKDSESICHDIDNLLTCYIPQCFEETSTLASYLKHLTTLKCIEHSIKDICPAVVTLLAEFKALGRDRYVANSELIDPVIDGLMDFFNAPDSAANIELAIKNLTKNIWGKKLAAAAMVVVGLAIVTVSVAAAVASFGCATFLSSIGIAVATTVIANSLAIIAGVSGIGVVACGVALANDNPLNSFQRSARGYFSAMHEKKHAVPFEQSVDNSESESINASVLSLTP